MMKVPELCVTCIWRDKQEDVLYCSHPKISIPLVEIKSFDCGASCTKYSER